MSYLRSGNSVLGISAVIWELRTSNNTGVSNLVLMHVRPRALANSLPWCRVAVALDTVDAWHLHVCNGHLAQTVKVLRPEREEVIDVGIRPFEETRRRLDRKAARL